MPELVDKPRSGSVRWPSVRTPYQCEKGRRLGECFCGSVVALGHSGKYFEITDVRRSGESMNG